EGGIRLVEMIVPLSGIGKQGIRLDMPVHPCPIGATPAIGHSASAENIVKSCDRRILAESVATVKTGLPGFCDYYVIGQFRPEISSIGKDAGTVCVGVVVGNSVIDECRSTDAGGTEQVETSAVKMGLIACDEILDDQRVRITLYGEAASLVGIIPFDDISFDDRGFDRRNVEAAPSRTRVFGDHIVQDLCSRSPLDADCATKSYGYGT